MQDDLCDENFWARRNVVTQYSNDISLQLPEAMIFLKYKDEIWGQRILDIGCGGGRTSYILKKIATSYIGIDFCEAMVDACKQKFGTEEFMYADVRDLHVFQDCSFDFVMFSFNGFDCINHAGRLTGLREIYRVLKPQRLFVFSSHNRNYKYARTRPRLSFGINPITQLSNVYYFILAMRNYLHNRKKEIFCPEYAIICDQDYDHSHLHYYIGKEEQIGQAKNAGFQVIEMYDLHGNLLQPQGDDSYSAWIYYVARKAA